jgi:hypothetical protein
MALFFPKMEPRAVAPGRVRTAISAIAFLLLIATAAFAQSINPLAPTPVRANTVEGRIGARDIGDARLTDHYYRFSGTPGDLLITVQSRNLNGDIDVFTATSLRPLIKITLYAEIATPVTKGIYLRKREDLVMRVQARTPSDEEGTYRLSFGGSFEPVTGEPELAETETPATEPPPRTPGSRRVTSAGARIDEPPPPRTEVAAAPTPEPTPDPTPEPTPVESPSPSPEKAAEPEAEKPSPPRGTRGRRPSGRRPPARTRETATAEVTPPKPAPEPEPEAGPRLVIETLDGTLINRSMSSVRRVTVENGQVVVLNRDGTINRIALVNILRMSISP